MIGELLYVSIDIFDYDIGIVIFYRDSIVYYDF